MSGERRPKVNEYDGHCLSLLVPEENYRYATNYQPHPGDVFLVSYPKCGNTWLMQIVYLLTHDAQPVPKDKKLYLEIPFLEFEGKNAVEVFDPPRILKCHLPLNRMIYSDVAKYIYILRNPKDCCVSLYHHTRGYVEDYDFAEGTFDEFFEAFMDGKVDSGNYFDHLMSWWEKKDTSNVLLLTYEWMKQNNREGIIKIANFLGGKAAELVKDEEKLQSVLEASSFDNMKKNPSQFQYDVNGPSQFFRKAAVGDWRNYFSEEQSKRIDDTLRKRTDGTDITLIWKDFNV